MNTRQIKLWEKDVSYFDQNDIEVTTILKHVPVKGKKILDVGCGIGRLSVPLASYAKDVVAVDIDKDVIAYCKKQKNRKNIRYVHTDIKQLKEKEFDTAVWAQSVFVDLPLNLKAIHSRLKKNGKMIILRWVDPGNEYNKILSPFYDRYDAGTNEGYEKYFSTFTKHVKRSFTIEKTLTIKPVYSFPSRKEMLAVLKNDIPGKATKKDLELLESRASLYNHEILVVAVKVYVCKKK